MFFSPSLKDLQRCCGNGLGNNAPMILKLPTWFLNAFCIAALAVLLLPVARSLITGDAGSSDESLGGSFHWNIDAEEYASSMAEFFGIVSADPRIGSGAQRFAGPQNAGGLTALRETPALLLFTIVLVAAAGIRRRHNLPQG